VCSKKTTSRTADWRGENIEEYLINTVLEGVHWIHLAVGRTGGRLL
jgi:hypothetical protein